MHGGPVLEIDITEEAQIEEQLLNQGLRDTHVDAEG